MSVSVLSLWILFGNPHPQEENESARNNPQEQVALRSHFPVFLFRVAFLGTLGAPLLCKAVVCSLGTITQSLKDKTSNC